MVQQAATDAVEALWEEIVLRAAVLPELPPVLAARLPLGA